MNPYFTGSPIPDMSGTILHAAQMGQQNRQFEQSKALQERELNAKFGVLGQQFTPSAAVNVAGRVKALGLDKALQPELQQIFQYGQDPNYTNELAHDDLVSNWPQKKNDIMARLQEDITGKIAKDPNFANTPQGKKTLGLLDMINEDADGTKISSMIFPGVAEAKQLRKGVGELETVIGADGQPILVPRSQAVGQTPYIKDENTAKVIPAGGVLMKDGKVVYSNPSTGKITANVALNPDTGNNEYLMSDGSFSGKVAGQKPKAATGIEIARVQKLIQDAGANPTISDVALINEQANLIGYNYEKVPGKPATYGLPGTNAFNWKGSQPADTYQLVPMKQNNREAGTQKKITQPTQNTYETLPDAKQFSGKTAKDTISGKRYRSDGINWIEVQ